MQKPIDFSTEFGSRVAQRLKSEETIWLTSIHQFDPIEMG